MSESRDELFARGWEPVCSGSIDALLLDSDIVYEMQCPKCENPPKRGGLRLEYWSKRGQRDKAFTICRKCGLRRPF